MQFKTQEGKTCLLRLEAIVRSPSARLCLLRQYDPEPLLPCWRQVKQPGRHHQWMHGVRDIRGKASMCSLGLTGEVYSEHLASAALVTQGTAFRWLLLLSFYKHGVAKCSSVPQMPLLYFQRKLV